MPLELGLFILFTSYFSYLCSRYLTTLYVVQTIRSDSDLQYKTEQVCREDNVSRECKWSFVSRLLVTSFYDVVLNYCDHMTGAPRFQKCSSFRQQLKSRGTDSFSSAGNKSGKSPTQEQESNQQEVLSSQTFKKFCEGQNLFSFSFSFFVFLSFILLLWTRSKLTCYVKTVSIL